MDYVLKRLVSNLRCNRCSSPVLLCELEDYPYQCLVCEEVDPYDYMTNEEAGEIGVMGYRTSEDTGLLEVQLNI